MTSCGVRFRTCNLFGSSQTRIEYWPAPNTVTLPTPGNRDSSSRTLMVAQFDRNRLSYVLFGDVNVTNNRIAVDLFCTVTPWFWTDWGSCDSALDTRICTSTCAKLRSVPILKVTVTE